MRILINMENSSAKKRYDYIDFLKGIAMIAVLTYHGGYMPSGFLGVELFFVISGFLTIPSLINKIVDGNFSYIIFLRNRLLRLLPLIVLAIVVSLVAGYFLMLPDHYENLSQASVAAGTMSENILSAITTGNYWNTENEFRPLMHLWYVGVLFQFYIFFPPILWVIKRIFNNKEKEKQRIILRTALLIVFFCSLLLFLFTEDETISFYGLHCRFHEIAAGGLIGMIVNNGANIDRKISINKITPFATAAIIIITFSSLIYVISGTEINTNYIIGSNEEIRTYLLFPKKVGLLSIEILTLISLYALPTNRIDNALFRSFCWLGKISFGIFIWHQIIIAFCRYSFYPNLEIAAFAICGVLSFILAYISYILLEKRIKYSWKQFFAWITADVLLVALSFFIYLHSGVVRDVPELDVYLGKEHRGMFAEYCDRIYQYDSIDFNSNKIPMLLVGNSFARDFGNVILESDYCDNVSFKYIEDWDYYADNDLQEISKFNLIFCFCKKDEIPEYVLKNINKKCRIIGIGTKNYGTNDGVFNRNKNISYDYTKVAKPIISGYVQTNEELKKEWKDDYIDLLSPTLVDSTHIRIFTDDGHYISHDGRHLTPAGAKWYATKVIKNEFKKYLSKNK